jgi:NADH:ubiquinone reductase (H+-translocating)
MSGLGRRLLIGLLAGVAGSVALIAAIGHGALCILLGLAVGAAYAAGIRPVRATYADNVMTAAALGIPLWGLVSVIAIPLLGGQMPQWSAEQMRQHFPALLGWMLYGAILGLATQALSDVAERVFGPESEVKPPEPAQKTRIVILGGGFAGMKTAECLEEELLHDRTVSIILVNETNALLFTPMLAEVAGSSLEPSHISTPLRSSLPRTEVIRATVRGIDLERKCVSLSGDSSAQNSGARVITYDHLVLALGSVSNYLGMANVQKLDYDLKSLLDAILIRNRVI